MREEIKQRVEMIRKGEVPEGYKKTKVGIIPEEWEVKMIKDIARQVNRINKNNKKLTVLSCTKYDGLVDSLKYFKRKVFSDDLSKYKIVSLNDFAYATNHIEEGSIGLLRKYESGLISPMYTVFSTKEINNSYLFSLLKTHKYINEYKKHTIGSINRRGGLRWSSFSTLRIPFPQLSEQQTISQILSTADKAIDTTETLITLKKQKKKWLMQNLLTGKVRLPEYDNCLVPVQERIRMINAGIVPEGYKETKVGIIPNGWENKKFNYIVDKIIGGGTPSRKRKDYYNGDIPWATVKDLTNEFYKRTTIEYITQKGLLNSSAKLIKEKNIIISTRMGLGRGFINLIPMAINQDLKGIYIKKNIADVVFIMYWYKYNGRKISYLGNGSTVKGINLKSLISIKIPLPSLPEQTAIANILSTADKEIDLLKQKLDTLKQQKKALMQLLLTGIVRTTGLKTNYGTSKEGRIL